VCSSDLEAPAIMIWRGSDDPWRSLPTEADTKLEATRDLICGLDYGENVLVDLVRTFLPEQGLKVVANIDGFLEMIENWCEKSITYDPVKLMAAACREIGQHRTAGSTWRERALCARVEELATEITKGLLGFNRIGTVQVRTFDEHFQGQIRTALCLERLEELASLLGIQRSRLEKLYDKSCSRVKLIPQTAFKVNHFPDVERLYQLMRDPFPEVFIIVSPQDQYRKIWLQYCEQLGLPCDLTWNLGGADGLGGDDISGLVEDWSKEHMVQPTLDSVWELDGLGVSLPPPLVEQMQMRPVAPSAGVGGSQWEDLFVGE